MLRCQGNDQSEMIWITQRNNVARSPYRCCHGSTIMRSFYVVVDGHVDVNNITILRSSRKVTDFLFNLKEIWGFRQILVGVT